MRCCACSPECGAIAGDAQSQLTDIDMMLLWQSAESADEFAFGELAKEYFGAEATVSQQTATLLALQQAPMYFYKRGRGATKRAGGRTEGGAGQH